VVPDTPEARQSLQEAGKRHGVRYVLLIPASPRRPGAREHDGLYLRGALGFSAYQDRFQSDTLDGMITGIGTASEFAVGGTVSRGLVLGGGIYSTSVLAWALLPEDRNVPLPAELEPTSANFSLIGPFVDYYFDPRRGFHLQGALGFAALTGLRFDQGGRMDTDYAAFGGGLMVGLGHEWWVGDEWSLGVLGRMTVAYVRGDDDQDVGWGHFVSTFPSVLATITYH
jgi:hypothetical protein